MMNKLVSENIEKFAYDLFKDELDQLYYPELIVLPITQEGESVREELYKNKWNDKGDLIQQSISRYGAYEHNFTYENEVYLAILVNND